MKKTIKASISHLINTSSVFSVTDKSYLRNLLEFYSGVKTAKVKVDQDCMAKYKSGDHFNEMTNPDSSSKHKSKFGGCVRAFSNCSDAKNPAGLCADIYKSSSVHIPKQASANQKLVWACKRYMSFIEKVVKGGESVRNAVIAAENKFKNPFYYVSKLAQDTDVEVNPIESTPQPISAEDVTAEKSDFQESEKLSVSFLQQQVNLSGANIKIVFDATNFLKDVLANIGYAGFVCCGRILKDGLENIEKNMDLFNWAGEILIAPFWGQYVSLIYRSDTSRYQLSLAVKISGSMQIVGKDEAKAVSTVSNIDDFGFIGIELVSM